MFFNVGVSSILFCILLLLKFFVVDGFENEFFWLFYIECCDGGNFDDESDVFVNLEEESMLVKVFNLLVNDLWWVLLLGSLKDGIVVWGLDLWVCDFIFEVWIIGGLYVGFMDIVFVRLF